MLVNVSEGTLKGEKLKHVLTSQEYYSFKGIPFAKPPVGPLRFKNPVPPDKYEGIWDATQERSPCMQRDYFHPSKIFGDEDCLYLNVFTPQLPEEGRSLKPVMFFIFGGGFTVGVKDSVEYGPDFLVAKDVILVMPNYRLHIFGFLNLGIAECPGNVGAKDQVAALKWTKQNIRHFGGDPNNITLFGNSSGASSVMHLLYSPLSKGLFQKVIVQSAPGLNFMTLEEHLERVFRAVKQLGFESKDVQELFSFLMKVPAYDLTFHASNVLIQQEKDGGEEFAFLPSVEIAGLMSERMFPDHFTELMKQDPGVPVLTGVTSQEGSFHLRELIKGRRPVTEFISVGSSLIVPFYFRGLTLDEETKKKVVNRFMEFYLHEKSTYEEIVLGIIDVISDALFIKGHHDFVKSLLEHSSQNVYIYKFTYKVPIGLLESYLNDDKPSFLKGASHAAELPYLLYSNSYYSKGGILTPEGADKKIHEYVITVWTGFAKTSNPGKGLPVNWRPVTSMDKSYLEINEELTIRPGMVFDKRMEFIDGIYKSLESEQSKSGSQDSYS